MTPSVVHRYSFRVTEAIEALIGDAASDCEALQLRVDGDLIVIDVVTPTAPAGRPAAEETPPVASKTKPAEETATAKRKGGPLAQKAGIISGERGFWTFVSKRFGISIQSADDAATWLRTRCGIASRSDLDHDDRAAATFRDIGKAYALWLEGYD